MRYGMSDTEQLRGRLRVRTPHTSQRQTRHDRQEIQTVTITKSRTQKREERWREGDFHDRHWARRGKAAALQWQRL